MFIRAYSKKIEDHGCDAVGRVDSFIYSDRLWTGFLVSGTKKKSQYELVVNKSVEYHESKIKEHYAV